MISSTISTPTPSPPCWSPNRGRHGRNIGNVVFIVWRESIEALLVIGILQAWLSQQGESGFSRGSIYLWAGVAAGLVAAAPARDGDDPVRRRARRRQAADVPDRADAGRLRPDRPDGAVDAAAWPHAEARPRNRVAKARPTRQNWWGVFTLAAVAVAREGAKPWFSSPVRCPPRATARWLRPRLPRWAASPWRSATYALLQLGRQNHVLALVFPRHRNPAAAARRRAAADRRRQSRGAWPAAAPVRPALGRVWPACPTAAPSAGCSRR